jgi:hypothetical protein
MQHPNPSTFSSSQSDHQSRIGYPQSQAYSQSPYLPQIQTNYSQSSYPQSNIFQSNSTIYASPQQSHHVNHPQMSSMHSHQEPIFNVPNMPMAGYTNTNSQHVNPPFQTKYDPYTNNYISSMGFNVYDNNNPSHTSNGNTSASISSITNTNIPNISSLTHVKSLNYEDSHIIATNSLEEEDVKKTPGIFSARNFTSNTNATQIPMSFTPSNHMLASPQSLAGFVFVDESRGYK